MLTAGGSPLVVGMSRAPMKTQTVKVIRPFLIKGERVEIGTVIEVDNVLAGELKSANKAVSIAKPEMKPEPKPEPLKVAPPRKETTP